MQILNSCPSLRGMPFELCLIERMNGGAAELAFEVLVAGDVPELGQANEGGAELVLDVATYPSSIRQTSGAR